MLRSALVLLLVSTVAHAQPGVPPPEEEPTIKTPFDKGRFNLGLGLNFGRTDANERYYVFGGGLGYYVLDGVELGLGAAIQFGAGPTILRTTPGVRYVAQPLVGSSPLIPYIGTFFSHYFVSDGIEDVNTVGGRIGAIYVSGSLLLGLGLVVERTISECTMNCTDYYPELAFALSL